MVVGGYEFDPAIIEALKCSSTGGPQFWRLMSMESLAAHIVER